MFAHSYRLTAYPVVGGAIALALMSPPAIGRRGTRSLDLAIVAALAGIALQLVPLTPAARDTLAPGATAFERAMTVGAPTAGTPRPLSIEPAATAIALALDAALAVVFWSTTRALRRGGQRWLVRGVATIGLVVSPLALLDHLNGVAALEAIWPPIRRDLRAFGPFVSRNDFAGWLLLAAALTLGYLVARLEAHHREGDPLDPEVAFDRTGTRLSAALCLMIGGIMMSLSRSGIAGVVVGLVVFFVIGRRKLAPDRRRTLAIAIVVLLAAGVVLGNAGALSARLQIAMSEGMAGRWSVWTQTVPIVRDFWPVGTGIGGFARAMTRYQTSTRLITIAHADNELLQIAAEGGLLVGIPVIALVVALVATITVRLREDRTRMFWVRAGAASGLAAIAAQNMVEMTLRVPATGLLAVVVAAIAVHDRA